MIAALRKRKKLTQTEFGHELRTSAMAVSRWERAAQEPPAQCFVELGNIAGDPDCWYFWECAGLRMVDLLRVLPQFRMRQRNSRQQQFQFARAGGSGRKPKSLANTELVAIPLLKLSAGTTSEKGNGIPAFHEAPVESMIAAPKDWCPNPVTTNCLRVKGDSMNPLIYDGYILAVDSSQHDRSKLNGKIVIAWNEEKGLTVSRFRRYDHTEVLHPENREYSSVTIDRRNKWKILAKVLWWIGKAP